jgi:hypothetical protein
MKQQKTEIGAHVRAILPFHRIRRVIVVPQTDGSYKLKLHLDGPFSEFNRKTWDGSANPNKTATTTAGVWTTLGSAFNLSAPRTDGGVGDAVCSEQVIEMNVPGDHTFKVVVRGLRNYWLIPVVIVKDQIVEPVAPTEWDLINAMNKKGKASDQFPASSKETATMNLLTESCNKLLAYSSVGSKKDEDVSNILHNTCFLRFLSKC